MRLLAGILLPIICIFNFNVQTSGGIFNRDILNPDNLTIYFHIKATSNSFASEIQTIEFKPGKVIYHSGWGIIGTAVEFGNIDDMDVVLYGVLVIYSVTTWHGLGRQEKVRRVAAQKKSNIESNWSP